MTALLVIGSYLLGAVLTAGVSILLLRKGFWVDGTRNDWNWADDGAGFYTIVFFWPLATGAFTVWFCLRFLQRVLVRLSARPRERVAAGRLNTKSDEPKRKTAERLIASGERRMTK